MDKQIAQDWSSSVAASYGSLDELSGQFGQRQDRRAGLAAGILTAMRAAAAEQVGTSAVDEVFAPVLPNGDSITQQGRIGQKFSVRADGVVIEATVRDLVSLGAPGQDWKDPS